MTTAAPPQPFSCGLPAVINDADPRLSFALHLSRTTRALVLYDHVTGRLVAYRRDQGQRPTKTDPKCEIIAPHWAIVGDAEGEGIKEFFKPGGIAAIHSAIREHRGALTP